MPYLFTPVKILIHIYSEVDHVSPSAMIHVHLAVTDFPSLWSTQDKKTQKEDGFPFYFVISHTNHGTFKPGSSNTNVM